MKHMPFNSRATFKHVSQFSHIQGRESFSALFEWLIGFLLLENNGVDERIVFRELYKYKYSCECR